MAKPILCIDFDGVIHSYTSGWTGAHEAKDPPVEKAMEFLSDALEHFDVQIFSSRSNQTGGEACMYQYIFKHGSRELADALKYPKEKPPAFLTIDDRALTFSGEWWDPKELLDFKPWNRS
jgi:hypothetical protein